MNIYDFFFIWLSCLVSKCWHINKNRKDRRFLFICQCFETKQLSWIKNYKKFIISVHCLTRRQVHPVLKSISLFRTLTPNKHSYNDPALWFLKTFFDLEPYSLDYAECKSLYANESQVTSCVNNSMEFTFSQINVLYLGGIIRRK